MNVYEIVTSRIIKQLEQGTIPWRKPWMDVRAGARGRVKKGAKAEMVVFWKMLDPKDADDGDEPSRPRPILRYYKVFHISNVEGVEPLPAERLHETDPLEYAEAVFRDYVARESIKTETVLSNQAYYSPARDLIHLPDIRQYRDASAYYSVAFHEAVHSTGHCKRLARFGEGTPIAPFGSEDYSKEELVAELGSAAILNALGLETADSFQNSTAYIQNWITVLKNDGRFIVSASAKADKAARYILGKELNAA